MTSVTVDTPVDAAREAFTAPGQDSNPKERQAHLGRLAEFELVCQTHAQEIDIGLQQAIEEDEPGGAVLHQ